MSRNVSDTLKEQVFAQEMNDPAIILITITHADLAEDINVSSDPTEVLGSGLRGTISNGTEYTQFPFELVLQEQSENLLTRAKLRIDNVTRDIINAIRTARNDPPEVQIQVVLASDPDTVEINMTDLQLNNISATALSVEGELQPKIVQGEKFPKNTINQADFPAVFGR